MRSRGRTSSERERSLEIEIPDDKIEKKSSLMTSAYMSEVLDVWKGMFVICMLTEHTRSAFDLPLNYATHPILYVFSQIACSLDMTSFTPAYGFSCYRSYFAISGSLWTKMKRAARSVVVIYLGALFSNVVFDLGVFGNPPTIPRAIEFITLTRTYWDFLATFPLLLLMGFVSTRPALSTRLEDPKKQLIVYAMLLIAPLGLGGLNMDVCGTPGERLAGLFLGCIDRKPGSMRFSAVSYMFFFNLGAIVAHELAGVSSLREIPTLKKFFLGCLIAVELVYALPLLNNFTTISWEYIRWEGYWRFPMSYKTTLAWAFLSFLGFSVANLLVKAGQKSGVIAWGVKYVEHFGANTLLYLVINNLWITPIFRNANWHKRYSTRTWEYLAMFFALLSILLTRFLIYLVRTSRK